MLCVDGRPIYSEEHIFRLLKNAKAFGISSPFDIKKLREAVAETIEKNEAHKGRICMNTTITRGMGARGLATPSSIDPTLFIQLATASENTSPLHAVIAKNIRRNEGSPLSQIKSLNYGDNILARRDAEAAGANEAIMLNNAGHVTCFTVGNLFALKDGILSTPPLSDGVMDGIIRRLWIEREDITERSLTLNDLEHADGIFLTNSLHGIVPLASLNGKTLGVPEFPFDPDIHLG